MATIQITYMEDDTITFYARQQIWQQFAGPYTIRKCLYPWCNRMMTQNNFCVIYYDNTNMWDITSIQNMRPVCDVCYSSMRRPTMREWVDHMDYIYSMDVNGSQSSYGDASAPLSHGGASVPLHGYASVPLSRGGISIPPSHGDASVPIPLSHGDASVPIPLSHGERMNSHSSDGYVLLSHPSFSHPQDHMES
jgi:hypothetical protein